MESAPSMGHDTRHDETVAETYHASVDRQQAAHILVMSPHWTLDELARMEAINEADEERAS